MVGGYTMGSYCGRVRLFLAAAYVDFQRLPGNTTMVAQAPAPQPPRTTATATPPPSAETSVAWFHKPSRGRLCLKLQSFLQKAPWPVPRCGRL